MARTHTNETLFFNFFSSSFWFSFSPLSKRLTLDCVCFYHSVLNVCRLSYVCWLSTQGAYAENFQIIRFLIATNSIHKLSRKMIGIMTPPNFNKSVNHSNRFALKVCADARIEILRCAIWRQCWLTINYDAEATNDSQSFRLLVRSENFRCQYCLEMMLSAIWSRTPSAYASECWCERMNMLTGYYVFRLVLMENCLQHREEKCKLLKIQLHPFDAIMSG